MHSVLLIASGAESSTSVDVLLRREPVVVTRTTQHDEAAQLLRTAPFDLVICAIDEADYEAERCLQIISGATGVPSVVVTLADSIAPESLNIGTSFVCVESGLESVRTALQLQLRRARDVPRSRVTASGEFEFSFRFPARPDRIAKARTVAGGFIQRCLEVEDRELTRLELVLEEAICNAVYHGSLEIASAEKQDAKGFSALLAERLSSAPYCEREVEVRIRISEGELCVIVADEGPGFPRSDVAPPSAMSSSGRGLMLMQAFADTVEFNEVGNEVTITRRCRSLSQVESPSGVSARMLATQPQ